ncbi:T9SS type A sorting domain-containing protein [Flavobacterium amnicola]|uniref:T9SS type A sorting domain-containing protein n=1 Tax=Flavobacterium amnicola TaxID=2506422 RepID=A0A4Q1K477_9FLAO|nr:T9SS type A sorting domain-containing protein [Flavobacterium amnicola]RXR19412.1 T9SS type A sorting domain-containing protein [Flavobacterium amnicola]
MTEKLTYFKSIRLLLFFLLLIPTLVNAQADCSSAVIVCGNTQSFNPSGVGTKLEQLACGGIEHNSVWVAFQAKANGKLNFVIRPFTLDGLPSLSDFDWSLFALPGAPGVANCDAKTQLSCNFSGTGTFFGIPGATGMASPPYTAAQFNPGVDVVNGNWYVIIVDQFSNTTPLLFSIQFTDNPESPNLNSTPGIFDNKPNFAITNSSACAGTFSFTNSSVSTFLPNTYLWNFGDGSTSTAVSPNHTYVSQGTYYTTLTTTDANGCKSDIRKRVVFNDSPPVINTAGIFLTPSCTDSNGGTLTVTEIGATTPGVSGGTPPYLYQLVSPSAMVRPQQASNVFVGLQPGGYTVKVTDACGKTATGTVTVPQTGTNTTIGLGIQNIQSACSGSPTGTATIFANGTVPPYTMALVNSSPVLVAAQPALSRDPVTATYYTTFTGLLPGVYTVEATDACGKKRRATFTVTPSTLPVATAIASASCAGTATGTLNVTATAATGLSGAGSPGTYQYALIAPSPIVRPFQNSSVFENLLPGTYTVAVRDACNNIGTSTATIASATAPTFGTAFTTNSCPNGATGTIEAQIATVGGGSPLNFELIAPSPVTRPIQTSNLFANLPPGVYTVRLTDACGTQVTSTVTVNAASAPSFTTSTTAGCGTSANGTITVTPNASSIGPFTFELISPGGAIRPIQGSNVANSTSTVFTGLNQGTYTIRMYDGCGVPVTNVATVSAPTALAFPVGSSTVPSCSAGSTGQITVAQPTTGSAPYMYELIAPSPVIVGPQSSRIFNNVPTGNYTIRVTDACGTQVTIGAPLALAAATAPTLSVTNTSSCAVSTGTITCLATSANQGGGTYLYSLIAPSPVTRPNQSSPIFSGLPAGAYTIQITDQCGVTGTTTSTITAAGAFTPAAGGSVVSCNGLNYNGQIIVTSPQNFTPGGPIPIGSGGGPYTFALYDATNTVQLVAPQSSNIFPTVSPVAGSPTHTVRVTDVCGNTSTATVTINNPTVLTAAAITATTASCASSNTGVIRVTTVSSGGLAPYSYTLIDAVTTAVVAGPQTSIVFNGVPANGVNGYLVRTTDACGNVINSAAPLLFPAAVVPTATTTTLPSCAAGATGRITVSPNTGATLAGGTFSFSLYDAGNTLLVAGTQSSPVFNNIAPGSYTVRITDRCGTVGTVAVTVTSTVTALTAAGTATGSCTSGSNGVITGSFTGGSLPVMYSLVNQSTMTVIAGPQSSNIFTGLAPGTYIVRTTDACGTNADSSNIVLGNLTTNPTITTSLAIDCSGSAIIAGFGAGGAGGPYTYAICNGAGCSSFGAYGASSTFTVNASGTYRISVQDRCGNPISSSDIVVNIPTKAVITNVNLNVACGPTTVTPVLSNVPNTPYYSIDGSNFSPTIGVLNQGTHTLIVSNYNAGTYGCASDPYVFNINSIAPTGVSPQLIPSTGTLADIVVTGTGIIWYATASDAANAVNPLPMSTVVTDNTTYYATQTIAGCASTASLAVFVDTFLSANEFNMNAFTYSPNPTENILKLSYTDKLTKVVVYNIIGKQMFTKLSNNNTVDLDMTELSDGVYFVKIFAGDVSKTVKVIKK